MAESKLGQLATDEKNRDAVHVAVIPAVLVSDGHPSMAVAIFGNYAMAADKDNQAVGIVDPFLRGVIQKGTKVWILMYPNTVNNLRHDWDHPAIPEPKAEEPELEDDYDGCSGC